MLVFLFVSLILLSFLGKSFHFGFEGGVDLYENSGSFMVTTSSIPIYSAELYFEQSDSGSRSNSIIIKRKNKVTEIHLNADKKDDRSIVRIANYPAFNHVLVRELNVKVSVGKKDDAFFTTMVLTTVRVLFYSLLSLVKSRFNTEINERFDPEFNTDKLAASFSGMISVSLADIIYSYLASKFHKKQKLQEVKQN